MSPFCIVVSLCCIVQCYTGPCRYNALANAIVQKAQCCCLFIAHSVIQSLTIKQKRGLPASPKISSSKPLSKHFAETIKDMEVLSKPWSRGGIAATTTYTIHTEEGAYVVPLFPFNSLKSGMDVAIEKSYLTGAVQKLLFNDKSKIHHCSIGFVRTGLGKWLVPLILLSAAILLLFLPKIDNLKGANNLSIAVLLFSMLILLSYLGVTKL